MLSEKKLNFKRVEGDAKEKDPEAEALLMEKEPKIEEGKEEEAAPAEADPD